MRKHEKIRTDPLSLVLRVAVRTAATLTSCVVLFIVGWVLIMGVPRLSPSLFAWEYNSTNVSLVPAFINTVLMTVLALLLAAPLGIFAAIYLSEYARRGNKFVRVIRMTAETLAGIPSIVYGLFGMILFVVTLKWGYSMLAGGFTLAIVVLPLIMRTTEEALMAVPDAYREGAFALGAGRLRTVFRIILPAASPGIMAGMVLATGRIVGESAALIFTAGTLAKVASNPMNSARTLSVHMYNLSSEGLHVDQAYATAVVLLVLVVGLNALSALAAKKMIGDKVNG
jgi:phosphate transport system permease protein